MQKKKQKKQFQIQNTEKWKEQFEIEQNEPGQSTSLIETQQGSAAAVLDNSLKAKETISIEKLKEY